MKIIKKKENKMTKKNLEQYKRELGEIFYEECDNQAEMFEKIKTKCDSNIRSRYGQTYVDDILDWMAKPYKVPILDDAERKYLSDVIRPFRKEVATISKFNSFGGSQYIYIGMKDSRGSNLPTFPKGTMYKGMIEGMHYSLKELGL